MGTQRGADPREQSLGPGKQGSRYRGPAPGRLWGRLWKEALEGGGDPGLLLREERGLQRLHLGAASCGGLGCRPGAGRHQGRDAQLSGVSA